MGLSGRTIADRGEGGAGLPDTSPWRDPRGAGEARRDRRSLYAWVARLEGGLYFFCKIS